MKYRPTVLVADDSETFGMFLYTVLSRLGFDIIPVENGEEALELTRKIKPDIVILDIDMPKMDGITALRHLKEDKNTSSIPVVMCSVHADKKTVAKCEQLKCSGYLSKPIEIRKIHNIIHDCITFSGRSKRKFLRTAYNKRVSVSYNEITNEYNSLSLSEGGMYIREKNPPPKGTKVTVNVPVSEGQSLSLEGEVIYTKGLYTEAFKIEPGMAIEFTDVSKEKAQMLSDIITAELSSDVSQMQDSSQ